MLRLTEKAAEELKRVNVPHGKYLRLRRSLTGELVFGVDFEKPGDQVVFSGDSKLLLVDPGLSGQLETATMDFKISEKGPRFCISSRS
ncbi:MAG: hypothetical protein ACE5JS_08195 [Nitrospinota bacterium]